MNRKPNDARRWERLAPLVLISPLVLCGLVLLFLAVQHFWGAFR